MRTLEVVPNLHQVTIRGGNVFVVTEETLTLVDTGLPGSSAAIIDFIRRRLGRAPEEIGLIIITHNHLDHMGAVPELRRVADFRIAAHKDGLASADGEPSYREGMRRVLRVPLLSPLRRHVVLESGDVDMPLAGGEVLEPLGGLEVVNTPGHTPGSISLYLPAHRLLLVGDALQRRRRRLRLPAKMVSTDMELAIASVHDLLRLDVDVICFGHGRPLTREAHAWLEALASKARPDADDSEAPSLRSAR